MIKTHKSKKNTTVWFLVIVILLCSGFIYTQQAKGYEVFKIKITETTEEEALHESSEMWVDRYLRSHKTLLNFNQPISDIK